MLEKEQKYLPRSKAETTFQPLSCKRRSHK